MAGLAGAMGAKKQSRTTVVAHLIDHERELTLEPEGILLLTGTFGGLLK